MKKKKVIFLILLFFLLFNCFFKTLQETEKSSISSLENFFNSSTLNNLALAADDEEGRELEINYPEINSIKPEKSTFPINKYVEYIFNFVLWGVGFLVLLIVVSGGVQYLGSVENPKGQKEAKDRITSALVGLLLLVSSVVVLNQINADLIKMPLSETEKPLVVGPGIWLCSETVANFEPFMKGELSLERKEREDKMQEIKGKCYKLLSREPEPKGFEIKQLYIINFEDASPTGESPFRYAVVFHQENTHLGNRGKCITTDKSKNVENFDPESMTPLMLRDEAEGEGVTLYNHRECNKNIDEDDGPISKTYLGSGSGYSNVNTIYNPDMNPCYSLGIDKPTNWIAIAYKEKPTNTGGFSEGIECEVFDETNNDLIDDYVGEFCAEEEVWKRIPCIVGLTVLKGQIMDDQTE
jgi:hypothetical protein